MLPHKLKGRSPSLTSPGNRRSTQRRIIVSLILLVRRIVDHGLAGFGISNIMAIRTYQVRRIGFVLQKLCVINPQLVQQDMKHPHSKRSVRTRPYRHPLISLARCIPSNRIDHHQLHPSGTGIGHVPKNVVESAACRYGKLGSYEDAIVRVVKIGLLVKAAAGEELHRMNHFAASGRCSAHNVRSTEGAAQGRSPVHDIPGYLPSLDAELLWVVTDLFEL